MASEGPLLIQQELDIALNEKANKPPMMSNEKGQRIELKVVSLIRLALVDDFICDVLGENSATKLWMKLKKPLHDEVPHQPIIPQVKLRVSGMTCYYYKK